MKEEKEKNKVKRFVCKCLADLIRKQKENNFNIFTVCVVVVVKV